MQPLTKPQNKYWLTFGLCALAAALVFWVLGFLNEKVGRGLEAHFGKSVKRAA